ncbi:ankyrin repeat domain-containing protein SOWAHB-like [Hemitrygon akajei]|uniref:ankyrin repeat domain-containing protein SOWAHB-like n=1 Tax=Hemitrygon akajei TaxID=2704970 RepID=UPI003BFA13AC
MAEAFSQEAVLDFLLRHGGKVQNVDLTAHFRSFLRDPEGQLENRERFKKFVNSLAVVKVEDGVKYIALKKRYAEFIPEEAPTPSEVLIEREKVKPKVAKSGLPRDSGQLSGQPSALGPELKHRERKTPKGSGRTRRTRQPPDYSAGENPDVSCGVVQARNLSSGGLPAVVRGGNGADEESGSQTESARDVSKRASEDQPARQKDRPAAVLNNVERSVACKSKAQSARKHKRNTNPAASIERTGDTARLFDANGNCGGNFGQPLLVSATASPILSHVAPPVAKNKERKHTDKELPDCNSVKPISEFAPCKYNDNSIGNFVGVYASQRTEGNPPCATKLTSHCRGLSSKTRRSNAKVPEELLTSGDVQVSPAGSGERIHQNQGELGCWPLAVSGQPVGNGWHPEKDSPEKHVAPLKGTNGPPHDMSKVNIHTTVPKVIDAPPNVKDTPASSTQTSNHRDWRKEEPLENKGPSEESSLVPLNSKEHQWIVQTAAGLFEQVRALFCDNPNLAIKKDFISGYTVLHWIAKHGNHRELTRFISCARKCKVTLNVNIRSNCGYTPLHIATMYGQLKVIQCLVNKYNANLNIRDHSGKKPWQYLNSDSPRDCFQLLGAPQHKLAKPSQISSTFSANDISQQKSSNAVTRKSSFSALIRSPQLIHKFMHLHSDHLNSIHEEEEKMD